MSSETHHRRFLAKLAELELAFSTTLSILNNIPYSEIWDAKMKVNTGQAKITDYLGEGTTTKGQRRGRKKKIIADLDDARKIITAAPTGEDSNGNEEDGLSTHSSFELQSTKTTIFEHSFLGRQKTVSKNSKWKSSMELRMKTLNEELTDVKDDYIRGVIPAFMDTHSNDEMYANIVMHGDYIGRANTVLEQLKTHINSIIDLIKWAPKDAASIMLMRTELSMIASIIPVENDRLHNSNGVYTCHLCDRRMIISMNEIYCSHCGIVDSTPIVSECSNTADRPITQKGKDVSRHYDTWIGDILGEGSVADLPEGLIDRVAAHLRKEDINKDAIDNRTMRSVLKKLRYKKFSKNTLVIRLVGGPAPPEFTNEEMDRMKKYFVTLVELCREVSMAESFEISTGGNRKYYPFFIGEIVKMLFRNDPEKLRLLNYIHEQSPKTTSYNKQVFDRACETLKARNL